MAETKPVPQTKTLFSALPPCSIIPKDRPLKAVFWRQMWEVCILSPLDGVNIYCFRLGFQKLLLFACSAGLRLRNADGVADILVLLAALSGYLNAGAANLLYSLIHR